MKRKIEINKETVPRIFQVRSSLASFLKSSFSSRSDLNLSEEVFVALAGFSAFPGFSASTLVVVDFF